MHHHPNLVNSAVAKDMSLKLKNGQRLTSSNDSQYTLYNINCQIISAIYISYGALIFFRIYIRLNFWLTLLERHDHFFNGGKKNEFSPKAQDIFTSVF